MEDDAYHFIVFYAAILLLALYAGLIYLHTRRRAGAGLIGLLALALVSVEAAVNTTATSVTTTSRTAYLDDNQDVMDLVAGLKPEEVFYRVEKVDGKTKNDGAWMNFPTVSLFSSTANADMTEFFAAWAARPPPTPTASRGARPWWTPSSPSATVCTTGIRGAAIPC